MGAANAQINLHLGVKYASIRLNHAHSLVECLNGVESTFGVGKHGCKTELKVLWVQLSGETVAERLLFSRGNLDVVASSGQVAYNHASLTDILGPQAAANEGDRDWFWLVIGDREHSLGWVSINQFNPEDLRRRERGRHADGEIR